ncbi:hypothetical protein F5I97DRAFT_1135560 [Phlebopus sp. FC_14]|nr:hypothetical protein F5I97DRAFT_1135560 [Phlebopus sp. FC_14]
MALEANTATQTCTTNIPPNLMSPHPYHPVILIASMPCGRPSVYSPCHMTRHVPERHFHNAVCASCRPFSYLFSNSTRHSPPCDNIRPMLYLILGFYLRAVAFMICNQAIRFIDTQFWSLHRLPRMMKKFCVFLTASRTCLPIPPSSDYPHNVQIIHVCSQVASVLPVVTTFPCLTTYHLNVLVHSVCAAVSRRYAILLS